MSLNNHKFRIRTTAFVLFVIYFTVTGTGTSSVTSTADPAKTRGYDIVLAIDETETQPVNLPSYVANVWTTIQDFSSILFSSTKHGFYIRRAELVVPNHWNITADATTQNHIETAHLRVSSKTTSPRTENPNSCSLPGNFIELPFEFFEQPSVYANASKALLNLWARYRFGVWEEHGYPGSLKFPYFYKANETHWKPVGCSDEELRGEYRDIEGDPDHCSNNGQFSPRPECRFYPSTSNTAASSLMYLPSLPSVQEFCTDSTHNKEAPNKQNIFCGHRSTWEVIGSSPDWNSGGDLIEVLPPVVRKVGKKTMKPMFYMLLDRGSSIIPPAFFANIKIHLESMFKGRVGIGSLAGLGFFPSDDYADAASGQALSILKEVVPWTMSTNDNYEFKK